MKKIYIILVTAVMSFMMLSCSKDKFTDSIFDTVSAPYDTTSATGYFDKWLYDNFVVPYNTEIQYKFSFVASQMEYQLAPADYKKSQLLAQFIKYLFYDVYTKYGGEEFMKKYGPRSFHFIGSAAYSPTTGTETLGYASSGIKITLIDVNSMKTVEPGMSYTSEDIDQLNKAQFHVMHHEFSHILHQTKSYPVAYGQVTPASYDGRNWQKRDSTLSHQLGYVTHYASSANTEDFVEMLSCTITDNDYRWMSCIIDACLNGGVKEGDKNKVYTLIDSLHIQNLDDKKMAWNTIKIYREYDEAGKLTGRYVTENHIYDSYVHAYNEGKELKYDDKPYKEFDSFRSYLNWVETDNTGETIGINAIIKKMDIATQWYKETFGLNLFDLREEVRQRQNNVNEFLKTVVIYEPK